MFKDGDERLIFILYLLKLSAGMVTMQYLLPQDKLTGHVFGRKILPHISLFDENDQLLLEGYKNVGNC